MAIARFRGIMVLLAAIMVSSVLSTALAAERSRAGGGPDGEEWRVDWFPDTNDPRFSAIIGQIGGGWVAPMFVSATPSSTDANPSGLGYYEASITLTDAGLSGAVPKEFAARRLADIVQIARSRTVLNRAAEALSRFNLTSDPVAMVASLDAEATQGGITVSIRHSEQSEARTSVDMIAQEIITRCQELDRSPKPLLSTAGTPAKVTSPMRNRIGKWFFLQDNLLRTWIIFNCVGILLGIVVGRFVGRKYGSLRFYPVLAALTILILSGTGLWWNKERSRSLVDICVTTLICDPTSPANTPAEIMRLAKNKVVLDRAARVLEQYNIRTTPEHVLAGLTTERINESDVIWIKLKVETELESRTTVDVIAGETIKRYRQLHVRDASVQTVQILDPAEVCPVPVRHAANLVVFFGVPIAACLITLLIAYPISHRMAQKRRTKPKPVG